MREDPRVVGFTGKEQKQADQKSWLQGSVLVYQNQLQIMHFTHPHARTHMEGNRSVIPTDVNTCVSHTVISCRLFCNRSSMRYTQPRSTQNLRFFRTTAGAAGAVLRFSSSRLIAAFSSSVASISGGGGGGGSEISDCSVLIFDGRVAGEDDEDVEASSRLSGSSSMLVAAVCFVSGSESRRLKAI